MKRFASQFLITNTGPMLKRAVVTTDDDGRIISIMDTGGELKEEHSTEFHNGIIIPGFVNCHCHLEFSHLKKTIPEGEGLGSFIEQIRTSRSSLTGDPGSSAYSADNNMYRSGISLCADVCNTTGTFGIKRESRIKYISLIEVFGIDQAKAGKRMNEALMASEQASEMDLPFSLVPHSAYSVSLPLFRLLKKETSGNKVTSMHFMETPSEKEFLDYHTGSIRESYERTGLLPSCLEITKGHADAVLNEITRSGNLILVHNTFADGETVRKVNTRKNVFWCLCPNSNLYIERTIPPVRMLINEDCEIVVGTDSLASNNKLDILSELITLQINFPGLSIEHLVTWGTINGARALGEEAEFGTIQPGKKPGLLLLQNVDLQNMKLLHDSLVTRLI